MQHKSEIYISQHELHTYLSQAICSKGREKEWKRKEGGGIEEEKNKCVRTNNLITSVF